MNLNDHLRRSWLICAIGCILYIIGIGILFWNEGRAVNNALSLDEAYNNVLTVNAEDPIDTMYEGRLVHVTGTIITGEPLTEPDYGIQVLAVKLRRRVQMYQWIEEEMEYKFGESMATVDRENDKTYYYVMDWKDKLIDSSGFYIRNGHHNPTKMPMESRIQIADHVNIGYYELGAEIKSKITKFIDITSDSRPEDPSVKLHSGLYYHCNDIWSPEIGDLRIQFTFAGLEGSTYTVIGKLENGKIVPYDSSVNMKILLVLDGDYTLAGAFKAAHHSYKITTWSFRCLGWFLIFFAVTCTSQLLHLLLSGNRLFCPLAPDPVHPVSGNFILSFSVALVITSIAWIFHRPWLGFGMLLAAISPYAFCARNVVQYHRVPN